MDFERPGKKLLPERRAQDSMWDLLGSNQRGQAQGNTIRPHVQDDDAQLPPAVSATTSTLASRAGTDTSAKFHRGFWRKPAYDVHGASLDALAAREDRQNEHYWQRNEHLRHKWSSTNPITLGGVPSPDERRQLASRHDEDIALSHARERKHKDLSLETRFHVPYPNASHAELIGDEARRNPLPTVDPLNPQATLRSSLGTTTSPAKLLAADARKEVLAENGLIPRTRQGTRDAPHVIKEVRCTYTRQALEEANYGGFEVKQGPVAELSSTMASSGRPYTAAGARVEVVPGSGIGWPEGPASGGDADIRRRILDEARKQLAANTKYQKASSIKFDGTEKPVLLRAMRDPEKESVVSGGGGYQRPGTAPAGHGAGGATTGALLGAAVVAAHAAAKANNGGFGTRVSDRPGLVGLGNTSVNRTMAALASSGASIAGIADDGSVAGGASTAASGSRLPSRGTSRGGSRPGTASTAGGPGRVTTAGLSTAVLHSLGLNPQINRPGTAPAQWQIEKNLGLTGGGASAGGSLQGSQRGSFVAANGPASSSSAFFSSRPVGAAMERLDVLTLPDL